MKQKQILKLASILLLLVGAGCGGGQKVKEDGDAKVLTLPSGDTIPSHLSLFHFFKSVPNEGHLWQHEIAFNGGYFLDSQINRKGYYSLNNSPQSNFPVDYASYQPYCEFEVLDFIYNSEGTSIQTTAYSVVKPSKVPPPRKNLSMLTQIVATDTSNENDLNRKVGKTNTGLDDQNKETLIAYKHLKSARFVKVNNDLQIELKFRGAKIHNTIYYLPYQTNIPNYLSIYVLEMSPTYEDVLFVTIEDMANAERILEDYVLLVKPWLGTYDGYPTVGVKCLPESMFKLLAFHF